MSNQLYYFSGTGNSLYFAKNLHKLLPNSELSPIVKSLKENKLTSNKKTVGFIFPLHAFSLPFVVKDFINQIDLSQAEYIYAIVTRGGSPCKVFSELNKDMMKKGKKLNTGFFINMGNNYILNFELQSSEELQKIDDEVSKKLEVIKNKIINKEDGFEKDIHHNFLLKNVVFPILSPIIKKTRYFGMEKKFYADNKCNSCGLCSKVCLTDKIEMFGDKPIWKDNTKCTFCFACLHYCPEKAVQIKKSKTLIRGRYHHNKISANDIMSQKQI